MTITRRPWSTLKKSSHKASQITTRTTRSRLAPFWKFMNSCNVTTAGDHRQSVVPFLRLLELLSNLYRLAA
jgi:hypothetical protein